MLGRRYGRFSRWKKFSVDYVSVNNVGEAPATIDSTTGSAVRETVLKYSGRAQTYTPMIKICLLEESTTSSY